jgi:hypothetical protein
MENDRLKQASAAWISRFATIVIVAMALMVRSSSAAAQNHAQTLNFMRDIGPAIAACWQAPHTDDEITLRLSFSRDGVLIGRPHITFMKPKGGSGIDKEAELANSIFKAVYACTPLHFTDALGASIAGRVLTIRFVGPRPPTRSAARTSHSSSFKSSKNEHKKASIFSKRLEFKHEWL